MAFYISIFDFYLDTLIKCPFLFINYYIIFKKLSNISSITLFNICLGIISSYFALQIIFLISNFRDMEDKKALGYIKYLEKNVI